MCGARSNQHILLGPQGLQEPLNHSTGRAGCSHLPGMGFTV